MREDSGPPTEAFQLEVTTRPMINLVWIGTLLLVFGGLISMRRRILENRLMPIPDLAAPEAEEANTRIPTARRTKNKGRVPTAKPAPSLYAGKSGRH